MPYWVKTYGPGHVEAIALDKNGDILAVGTVRRGEGFIARLAPNGRPIWKLVSSGVKRATFFDVKVAPDGDIIAGGEYNEKLLVLRMDPNGKIKWGKTYGKKFNGTVYSVAVAPDGSIFAVGKLFDRNAAVILKLSGSGDLIWHKEYKDAVGRAVGTTPRGEVVVVGEKVQDKAVSSYTQSIFVMKLGSGGSISWKKEYSIYLGGMSKSILSLHSSTLHFAISSNGEIVLTDSWCRVTLKLDADGNVLWAKNIWGDAVAVTSKGDVVLVDDAKSTLLSGEDGNVTWSKAVRKGLPIYLGKGITLSNEGDLILSGMVSLDGKDNSSEMGIFRLPTSVGIQGLFEEVSDTTTENRNVNVSVLKVEEVRYSKMSKRAHAEVRMSRSPVKEAVVYDDSNPEVTKFWKLISKDELEKAAKLFEELYPKISGKLIKVFIPEPLLLLWEDQDKLKAKKALIVIKNPHLSSLKVVLKIEMLKSRKQRSFGFTLNKGEKWMRLLKMDAWDNPYRVKIEFKQYRTEMHLWFKNVDEIEFFKALSQLKGGHQGLIESLLNEDLSSTELKKYIGHILKSSIGISTPELTEDVESEITVSVENSLFDSMDLEITILPNEFLEIEDPVIRFPGLKRGEKAEKTIEIRPVMAGEFDLAIKVTAENIELKGIETKFNIDSITTRKTVKLKVEENDDIGVLRERLPDKIEVSVPELIEGRKALLRIGSRSKRLLILRLGDSKGLLKFSNDVVGMIGDKSIEVVPKSPGNTDIIIDVKTMVNESLDSLLEFQKVVPVEIKENPYKKPLLDAIKFSIPSSLFENQETPITVKVQNTVFDSLKLTIEFLNVSGMGIYPRRITFSELKKGQQSKPQTLTIVPRFTGDKKLEAEINAVINGETKLSFIKTIPLTVKENIFEKNLLDSIKFNVPQLFQNREGKITVEVNNESFDSLDISMSFLKNRRMTIAPSKMEFLKVKKGEKITKTITVIPEFTGYGDILVEIEATINGSVKIKTKKKIPLRVVDPKKLQDELLKIIRIDIPELVEDIPAFMKVTVENTIADSLKIVLDLSDSGEFFEFERTIIEFPEIKRDRKISKSIAMAPKYAGEFDLNVKIKTLADGMEVETSKTIPVEVLDKATYLSSTVSAPEPVEEPYYSTAPAPVKAPTQSDLPTEIYQPETHEAAESPKKNQQETEEELYSGKVVFKIGSLSQERTGTIVITNKALKLEGKYRIGGTVAAIPIKAALRAAGVGEIHEEIPLEKIESLVLVKNALLSRKYHVEFTVDGRKFYIYTDAAHHIYNLLRKYTNS